MRRVNVPALLLTTTLSVLLSVALVNHMFSDRQKGRSSSRRRPDGLVVHGDDGEGDDDDDEVEPSKAGEDWRFRDAPLPPPLTPLLQRRPLMGSHRWRSATAKGQSGTVVDGLLAPQKNRRQLGQLLWTDYRKQYVPPLRVVHLDLKGAPPKLHYLKELLPVVADAGANALLIEYEDMFPYRGPVQNASALNAYSREQVLELVALAEGLRMEVIPLVQTFGHMEHILKLEEFSHLREVNHYPQSICPSKEQSFEVVRQMIDQVLELHRNSRFIHIGCDEVYQLGACADCKKRMQQVLASSPDSNQRQQQHQQQQQPEPGPFPTESTTTPLAFGRFAAGLGIRKALPDVLFLNHVKRTAEYVKDKNVKAIIWDDMLRGFKAEEIQASGLAKVVEPMVWVYVEDVDHFVGGDTWRMYSSLFPHVWTASAFKGAFGERLFIPNILRHYNNNLSWLRVMQRESGPESHGRAVNFRGMALTGWSRYDHFAVLCELLPVAVPSLVLNLVLVSTRLDEKAKLGLAERLLKCTDSISRSSLESDPHQFDLRKCKFPGSGVYGAVGSLAHFKSEVESLDNTSRQTQGWLTPYNIRHNYSSPWRLGETVAGHSYLVKALQDYSNLTAQHLSALYEPAIVEEWLEQNIFPLQEKMEDLFELVKKLGARQSWPRRPVP